MSLPPPSIRYLAALALCALTALVAVPLREWLDAANIAMLFLLPVLVAALRLGRGPAVLAVLVGVALFDFFFVPPHLTLSVADAQYLVTFAVMLAVGLLTSHLAARLAERERDARLLYEMARRLGAPLDYAQAADVLDRFFADLGAAVTLRVAEGGPGGEEFLVHGPAAAGNGADEAMARLAYERGTPLEAEGRIHLPFHGTTRLRGVLTVSPGAGDLASRRPLLEAAASLAGIAVERIHYAEIARRSELTAETEKLRSSLLSSISHDLRTPLTSLVGLADSLAHGEAGLPARAAETAGLLRDQARAMHGMVCNLLDMARLQAGRVVLNRQWQAFEEIIGSSLRLLDDALARRPVVTDFPADLPLVRCDAVLMERVVCNLLENAAKYSPAGSRIAVSGRVRGAGFEVEVDNEGAGFPDGDTEALFELFARGAPETPVPGTGIGLAVCRAIVAAHGGSIGAGNRPGGAWVRFTLPLDPPPAVEGEGA